MINEAMATRRNEIFAEVAQKVKENYDALKEKE